MAQPRVDIFSIIGKLQSKDRAVVTQEEQAAPFLLQRWLSGVSDELQVLLLNDVTNPYIFSLNNHATLINQLLLASTSGYNHRCKWIKQAQSKDSSKLVLQAISRYHNVTIKDAKLYASWMTNEEIIDAASFAGMQPDEIKQLKKQLK